MQKKHELFFKNPQPKKKTKFTNDVVETRVQIHHSADQAKLLKANSIDLSISQYVKTFLDLQTFYQTNPGRFIGVEDLKLFITIAFELSELYKQKGQLQLANDYLAISKSYFSIAVHHKLISGDNFLLNEKMYQIKSIEITEKLKKLANVAKQQMPSSQGITVNSLKLPLHSVTSHEVSEQKLSVEQLLDACSALIKRIQGMEQELSFIPSEFVTLKGSSSVNLEKLYQDLKERHGFLKGQLDKTRVSLLFNIKKTWHAILTTANQIDPVTPPLPKKPEIRSMLGSVMILNQVLLNLTGELSKLEEIKQSNDVQSNGYINR